MAVKSSINLQSLKEYTEEFPTKRPRMMNTPPDEVDELDEINNIQEKSVNPDDQVSSNEAALKASWGRLLRQIQEEIKNTTQNGPNMIPEIDFEDISETEKAQNFLHGLKTRGAAIIRNVIPVDEAAALSFELDSYLRDNPHTKASPPENPELYELFWSLAQLNARAHPSMLAAQKFVMSGCWHHHDHPSSGGISCNFPVTYADRVRMLHKSFRGANPRLRKATPPKPYSAQMGTGDDERCEVKEHNAKHSTTTDVYKTVWSGHWEDYDAWDGSTRASRTSDVHDNSNTSRPFKMFQGILPLSSGSSEEDPPMRMCSLPHKLTTAYLLLRPFFSPQRPLMGSKEDFLDPLNWQRSSAKRVGSPSLPRGLDDTFHPHLQLEQTLIELPPLKPGDYVIWHPDTIYAPLDTGASSELNTPSSTSPATSCHSKDSTTPPFPPTPPTPSTLLYIPACPLTLNNAKYLVHQRKAFLLGYPGPDFTTSNNATPTHDGPNNERPVEIGESYHMGRPGVHEINEAGGEEALRAMGLLVWDEDDAADASERALLKRANTLLFPDRAALR